MKCNWCGKGSGKNYVKDKKNKLIFYYYCQNCIGHLDFLPKRIVDEDIGPIEEDTMG